MANLPVVRQHEASGDRTGPDLRTTATKASLRRPAETVDPLALLTPRMQAGECRCSHLFQTSTPGS